MKIQDQVAVITGAASGMGLACAQHLHAHGARLILLDRNPDLPAIAAPLDAHSIVCDIHDGDTLPLKLKDAFALLGPARININCAGIAPAKRILGRDGLHSLAEFDEALHVNVSGTFNVMRQCALSMSEADPQDDNERGIIINTASIAAFEGQIGQVAYSASKGAIVSMTLPAARELAKWGIRVNCIAPGLVETPMLTGFPEAVQQRLVDQTLFPHRLAQPSEFAHLCQHIITNVMINGETLRLDGAVRLPPQ